MEILEYELDFIYEIKDELLWVDNFIPNNEWEIIRIKDKKTIQKSYMDRNPVSQPKNNYKIAIYNKNKWITLNNNKGNTVISGVNIPNIPNLKIKEFDLTPILSIYKFDFDYHTLITILQNNENVTILEYKRAALTEIKLMYKNMKLYINGALICYRGKENSKFKIIVREIEEEYKAQNKEIKKLMDMLDHPIVNPAKTHKAIAFKTWYNAKRENQREWPLISNKKEKNGIEFPKYSNIWYYYPNKYVGLAKRNDINSEKFIPKIYNTNHLNNHNSILYMYLNNIDIKEKIKIPNTVKNDMFKNIKNNGERKSENYIEIDYEGKVIEAHKKSDVLIFKNIILKNYEFEEKEEIKVQILDKDNKRVLILNKNDEWVKSQGYRIIGIPALPYNYRKIIHDYKKLGRLKEGPIVDLTHIGIVDKLGKDEITFPKTDNIYISKTLETVRTMSFKYIKNTKITIIYDN